MTAPIPQQKTLTFAGESIVVPEVAYATFMDMAAEVGRLHAVVANAPHYPDCQTWQPEDWPWSRDCTCWKADAL